jgi:two-component system, chemotaxis family, chemotaxis protein CheY
MNRTTRVLALTTDVVHHENDAVIAPAESLDEGTAIGALLLPETTSSRTVLIIDDDQSLAETYLRLLKLEGFLVAAAFDGASGLEMTSLLLPHAVVLDLRMPIASGLQFLRRMRSLPTLRGIPVVIVTGDYFVQDAIEDELTALGATIHFKPMSSENLFVLLRTLITE